MGRRLVKDAFRGWYNYESKFNAAQRMSNAGLQTTKVKNQHESNRLGFAVTQIKKNQSFSERVANRDLKHLRDEYSLMLALGKVYKQHSFDKYDPFLRESESYKYLYTSDIHSLDNKRLSFTKSAATRRSSIGPSKLRHSEVAENQGKWDTLRQNMRPVRSPSVNNSRQDCKTSTPLPTSTHTTFGRLVSNLGSIRKVSICESDISTLSSTRGVNAVGAGKGNFHVLAAIPEIKEFRSRIKIRPKSLPQKRHRTIFPGECKSTYEMRKFMDKEVKELLQSWTPSGRRQAKIEKLKQETALPILVHRSKTTSAILRDFRSYKQTHGDVNVR